MVDDVAFKLSGVEEVLICCGYVYELGDVFVACAFCSVGCVNGCSCWYLLSIFLSSWRTFSGGQI